MAKDVGQKITQGMLGENAFEHSFRSKEKVVNMDSKCVKVDGESVNVDPQLLFQRLLTAARDTTDDLESVLKFELCSMPSSLLIHQDFFVKLTNLLWLMPFGH